jgi:thymidylate synthase
MNKLDKTYQDLLQDILDNGVEKKDRTGTGTISVFGRQIRHKMSEGFPLLTTKKMPWKSIVTELLWFLQGNTNIKWLVDNGCNIWNGDAYKNYLKNCTENYKTHNEKVVETDIPSHWKGSVKLDLSELLTQEEFINKIKTDDKFASEWGELGPIYGKQWRKWKGKLVDKSIEFDAHTAWVPEQIDQIQNLINDLKTNPDSRRLMVNAWNVGELDQMVLPPCHYGFQVYTRELSLERRYNIWFNNNYETGMERFFDPNNLPDFDNDYYTPTPTRAISLMWNQRSVDTFLGLPFNIASYGLLLEIIAKEVNMIPDELIGNLGDVHLYTNHIEQSEEQIGRKLTFDERTEMLKDKMGIDKYKKKLSELVPFGGGMSEFYKYYKIPYETREPYDLPTLKFSPCPITGIDMEYQSIAQFQIENYESHPAIKAPLSN